MIYLKEFIENRFLFLNGWFNGFIFKEFLRVSLEIDGKRNGLSDLLKILLNVVLKVVEVWNGFLCGIKWEFDELMEDLWFF